MLLSQQLQQLQYQQHRYCYSIRQLLRIAREKPTLLLLQRLLKVSAAAPLVVHGCHDSFELLLIDGTITVRIKLCNHVVQLLWLNVNL